MSNELKGLHPTTGAPAPLQSSLSGDKIAPPQGGAPRQKRERFRLRLRRHFLAGLAAVLPIIISLFIIVWIYQTLALYVVPALGRITSLVRRTSSSRYMRESLAGRSEPTYGSVRMFRSGRGTRCLPAPALPKGPTQKGFTPCPRERRSSGWIGSPGKRTGT